MSLAIFSLNSQAAKTPGDSSAAKGEAAPATGFSKLFSVLQTGQSALQQAVRSAGDEAKGPAGNETSLADLVAPKLADGEIADALAQLGMALPPGAETGKNLPPALPVAGQASPATVKALPAGEIPAAAAATNPAARAEVPTPAPEPGPVSPEAGRRPATETRSQNGAAEAKPAGIDILSLATKAAHGDAAPKAGAGAEASQAKSAAPAILATPSADRNPALRNASSVPATGSSSAAPAAEPIDGMRSGGNPAGSDTDAREGRSQGGTRQRAEMPHAMPATQLRVAIPAGETVVQTMRQSGVLQAEAKPQVPGMPLRPAADTGETSARDAGREGAFLHKPEEQAAKAGTPQRLAPLATDRRSIADLGLAAMAAQDTPAPGASVVQTTSVDQSNTLSSASAFASRMPQPAEAQDIARIVDRLTAAREAVQPAAVAMAINHKEFGELSLRFDQLRTGQLSVHLSAANPEAQTALAAAASQHGANAGTPDNSAGAQTQQQQSQNAGRGAQAERDMSSGGNQPDRGERQRQGGNMQRQDAPPGQQRPRDGIFA